MLAALLHDSLNTLTGDPETAPSSTGELRLEDLNGTSTHSEALGIEPAAAKRSDTKEPAVVKKKLTMSATPTGKANGGPPTPTVKKVSVWQRGWSLVR